MVRNAGKFGKPKRGGGKHFTSARTLRAEDAEREGMWADKKEDESDEESEEEEESGSEDEESDGLGGTVSKTGTSKQGAASMSSYGASDATTAASTQPPVSTNKFAVQLDKFGNAPQMTKREAKKAAQAQKAQDGGDDSDDSDDSLDDVLQAGAKNKGVTKAFKTSSLNDIVKKPTTSQPMNRKEREEAAKKAARERYLEMHRAGKTDEAKADLARLAKIRKEREEAAARRKAEAESAEVAKKEALAKSNRRL